MMEDDKVVIEFRYHIRVTLTDGKAARTLYEKIQKELNKGKYGDYKTVSITEEPLKILYPGLDLKRATPP